MKRKRVLLIEDDIALEPIIDAILHDIDSQIEVDWVSSGEAALQKLEEASEESGSIPYDLVVADIFLEGSTNGIDLWNLCQNVFPQMPTVVMSGLPLHKFRDFVGTTEISPPYLEKPLRLSLCRQTLEAVLNSH